ncbi:hypothetical protein D3C72_1289440 [compost metagenome]
MPEALLQCGFENPDAVKFVTDEVGGGMVGAQQLGILDGGIDQLVVVVGNIDLPLPDNLPVVAFAGAIEQAIVIHGPEATRAERLVEAKLRCLSHAAGAGIVLPRPGGI